MGKTVIATAVVAIGVTGTETVTVIVAVVVGMTMTMTTVANGGRDDVGATPGGRGTGASAGAMIGGIGRKTGAIGVIVTGAVEVAIAINSTAEVVM